MSCNCSISRAWEDRIAVRAACCLSCPRARKRRRAEPAMCTVDGRRLRQRVADPRARCDRWPDGQGRVRWLGLLWIGVPAPRRWAMEARGLLRERELPGCGCLAALRRYWSEEEGTWRVGAMARDLVGWVRRWASGGTRAAQVCSRCSLPK